MKVTPPTVNTELTQEVVAPARPFPRNTAPCDWDIQRTPESDDITACHSSGYTYTGTMADFNKAMKP